MRPFICLAAAVLWASGASAQTVEITTQNDSIGDQTTGNVQAGFVAGEKAASWLTSPCTGTVVAVQVFWRSLFGGTPQSIESSIEVSRGGPFPIPGMVEAFIGGPVMTDGVFNEFRFLDDQNTIPLQVPVTDGERFVVTFTFGNNPPPNGPSLVTDANGCQAGLNSLFAIPPSIWFSSCDLGVSGDFAIRAVVECPDIPDSADLSIVKTANTADYIAGDPLGYTIVVSNSGSADANSATVIDFFPPQLSNVSWTCSGNAGATCSAPSGMGNIAQSINLPAGASVNITAEGTVLTGTTGDISNTAQIVVPAGITDPDQTNNTSTAVTMPSTGDEILFIDGFEA
ncbi:MAG: hypothetical protein Tsb002_02390 [Wenzhouxiangellaceae bacterium]